MKWYINQDTLHTNATRGEGCLVLVYLQNDMVAIRALVNFFNRNCEMLVLAVERNDQVLVTIY